MIGIRIMKQVPYSGAKVMPSKLNVGKTHIIILERHILNPQMMENMLIISRIAPSQLGRNGMLQNWPTTIRPFELP